MKRDKLLLIVVITALILALIVFAIIKKNDNSNKNNVTNNKLVLVDDYSTFFTVEDCVNRYIDYISDEEVERVLNTLNEEYKKENKLDNNTIAMLDTFNLKGNINYFKSMKMYQQKINVYKYRYYVYGKIYRETEENDMNFVSDYYVIVDMNNNTHTFDITPYDGKEFKEGLYE